MATIHVKPLPDGVAMRGNWEVAKGRTRKSTHTKKAAAESKARTIASGKDTIVIYGVNGQIQRKFTPSGSSSSKNRQSTSSNGVLDKPIQDSVDELGDLF